MTDCSVSAQQMQAETQASKFFANLQQCQICLLCKISTLFLDLHMPKRSQQAAEIARAVLRWIISSPQQC